MKLFNPAREGFADGTVNWPTGVIKAAIVRGYTLNLAHKFLSEIVGAGATIGATSGALTSKTNVSGVLDGTIPQITGVPANGSPYVGMILFQASAPAGGADLAQSAQRVIGFYDGKIDVTCAAAATTGATTVAVEALAGPVASGATIAFSGGVTATLSGAAIAGARTISVSATSGAIAAGETGTAASNPGTNNFPFTLGIATDITVSNGNANKWGVV